MSHSIFTHEEISVPAILLD